MANEQNEQAQDIQQEQNAQNENVEQVSELGIEDLQAKVTELEDSLKLEKARAANAIYEAEKTKERLTREAEKGLFSIQNIDP